MAETPHDAAAKKSLTATRLALIGFIVLALAAIAGPVILAGRYTSDPATLCAQQGDGYDKVANECVDE